MNFVPTYTRYENMKLLGRPYSIDLIKSWCYNQSIGDLMLYIQPIIIIFNLIVYI